MSVILLLFLFILPAFSEELDPVEVKAAKELSDFNLGSSESLSSEALQRHHSALISDAISDLNGVTPSQNGGPGGRVTYFIRGTEARHVSFTIDGLRINDTSNTDRQFDSAFLSSAFLKELTLYKGPQAVLFGSDAMGGLIDMRTRKGENAPETRLSVNGGSFGTFDTSLSHDWKTQKNHGTLTWSSMRTDGLSRLNKKRFNATERDAADVTQLTSSSRHAWAESWQTDFLFSYLRGNNELDGFTTDNSREESRNDQYMIQQKTGYDINAHSAVSLRTGLSRHQRLIKPETAGTDRYEGDLLQNEFLHNYHRGAFHLLSGLASEHETFENGNLEKVANLHSLFLQTAWQKNGFKAQTGIRVENHSRYGDFQTGAAGIGQTWGKETLTLQYSQGFKAPSLYQLHGPPIFGFPVGNDDLVPERNHTYELRWTHEGEIVKSEIAFFENRLANLITYGTQGYQNQGRFIARGIEASGGLSFQDFQIRPTLMYQDFREEESPILRRPQLQYGLEVAYFPQENLELFTKYKFYSSRKDIDENGGIVKLNEFDTVDVGARLTKGKNTFAVQILNIYNREYEELYGYSTMPRSVFGHYSIRF